MDSILNFLRDKWRFGVLALALLVTLAVPAVAQAEWETVLAEAKKEGQVMIAGGSDVPELFKIFQKRYPEIKVVLIPGRTGELANRIMAERRAGKYLVDLYIIGATTMYAVLYKGKALDAIKPALILPEVVDESKWWRGKHMYLDDEDRYIFAFNGAVRSWFAYNTQLVNPKEIKSYWDLVNPKWKGKIVGLDPASSGAGAPLRFLYYHPELGQEFIKRLLNEMEITVSRDMRQITDWLGTGKFAISVLTAVSRTGLDEAKKQGLPIDWFGPKTFKEGAPLNSASGNVGLLNRAPHPNAAKIALNWLLSREAQIAYQKLGAEADSLRMDIPKDDVGPDSRRVEGVKFIVLDERMDIQPIRKFVSEVWKKKG